MTCHHLLEHTHIVVFLLRENWEEGLINFSKGYRYQIKHLLKISFEKKGFEETDKYQWEKFFYMKKEDLLFGKQSTKYKFLNYLTNILKENLKLFKKIWIINKNIFSLMNH